MPSFGFNRIVILESLPDTDPIMTGEELFHYLKPHIDDNGYSSSVELMKFSSVTEFAYLVRLLIEEARRSGNTPVLHIEAHGNNDGTGLVMRDGSQMSWGYLADLCIELNKVTRFNLFLVVAACYSGDFYDFEFKLDKPSPFCTFIAPSLLANGSEMLDAFRGLYRSMLNSSNAWDALEYVRTKRLDEGEFVIKIAHVIFFRIYEFLFGVNRSQEKIIETIAKHNEMLRTMFGAQAELPTDKIHREILANTDRQNMENAFHQFFMIKDIPENEHKFKEIKIELERLLSSY